MTIQCCMCHKIRERSEWIRSEVPRRDEVSHTYCPACFDEFKAELRSKKTLRESAATA